MIVSTHIFNILIALSVCLWRDNSAFSFYGRTGLCIFQMALPRVNTRVFFFFFLHPFPAGSLCKQVCSSIPIFDSANHTRNWWFWIFQIHRTGGYVIPPTALFPTLVNTRVFLFFFGQIFQVGPLARIPNIN